MISTGSSLIYCKKSKVLYSFSIMYHHLSTLLSVAVFLAMLTQSLLHQQLLGTSWITQSFLFITCTDARPGSCCSHCFISRAEHNIQCAEVSPVISLLLLITLLLELSPSPMNAEHCFRFLLLILKPITPISKGLSRETEPMQHTYTHTHTHTHTHTN